MNKKALNVDDVCKLLDRKKTYGYKIIRDLNQELEDQGYYTTLGRVSAKYFFERMNLDPSGVINCQN